MKKLVSIVFALVLTVMCFAGCGTKTSAQVIDFNLTDEEYAFGVDKKQPELLAQVNDFVKEIKSNGKLDEICDKYFGNGTPTEITSAKEDSSKNQLVVATNAAFEPFEYTNGDKYLGIDMEVASLLAEKLGKELVIKNMDFDAVCLSVSQQKCDIAMAGLTVKEDRKEFVNFSDSYYSASQKLIVKSDDKDFIDCKSKEEVEKKLNALDDTIKIGVQAGTTGQFYVEGDESYGFDGLKAKAVGYKNGSLAVQDMLNGNVNYVIIDSAPAACITKAINEMK